ncbi:MAG TPA: DUF3306 domain-containing protein [Methyloversatilis sp.]
MDVADDRADGFFGRWSRLKREATQDALAPAEPVSPPVPAAAADAVAPPAELPPLESLDFESDYRGFLGARVDEGLKRAALSRLFHAPHFNTMDGLDVYIEDFNVFEPVPASMVAQLAHARETLSPVLPADWLTSDAPDDGAAHEEAMPVQPAIGSAVPAADPASEADAEDAGGPEQPEPPGGASRSVSE